MGHGGGNIGHTNDSNSQQLKQIKSANTDIVLEKNIFDKVFEKDIRKVFLYKKAERIVKAVHLVAPAFKDSPALRSRLEVLSVEVLDTAVSFSSAKRIGLTRHLLMLSSLLAIAHTAGILSHMNVELIVGEIEAFIRDITDYEEPRVLLEEVASLATLAKTVVRTEHERRVAPPPERVDTTHPSDIKVNKMSNRRETIVSVIRDKQPVSIKDISTVIRDVSEKTIQRELISLIEEGVVSKAGERRWSTYSLA
jgi:DNA-binding transcriptional ArsR family regulator